MKSQFRHLKIHVHHFESEAEDFPEFLSTEEHASHLRSGIKRRGIQMRL